MSHLPLPLPAIPVLAAAEALAAAALPPVCCLFPFLLSPLLTQAESAYLQNSRKRLAAASRPSKAAKITLIEDPREVRRLAGGADNAPVYQRKREVRCCLRQTIDMRLEPWSVQQDGVAWWVAACSGGGAGGCQLAAAMQDGCACAGPRAMLSLLGVVPV